MHLVPACDCKALGPRKASFVRRSNTTANATVFLDEPGSLGTAVLANAIPSSTFVSLGLALVTPVLKPCQVLVEVFAEHSSALRTPAVA